MKEKDLLKENIPYIDFEGSKYFSLKGIKGKYGALKYKIDKVRKVEEANFIQAEHIEIYTEFDRNIKKALNFKIKK